MCSPNWDCPEILSIAERQECNHGHRMWKLYGNVGTPCIHCQSVYDGDVHILYSAVVTIRPGVK